MKSILTFFIVALLSLHAQAADDLTAALQQGLFNEEADHDLASAIKAYQSVVAGADAQRKLAATAVFRLGECYRKLGQTNDAVAQYQRIMRDFGDQTNLVTLSRQNLVGLGAAKSALARLGDTAWVGLLEAQLAAKQADAAQASSVIQQLQTLNRSELRRVLPTVAPDQLLNRLLDEMALTVARATEQSVNLAPDHPQLKEKRDKIAALHTQIDERIAGIQEGLKVKAEVLKQQVEDLKRELANQPASRINPGSRLTPTPAQIEAHRLLIERLQLEIKTTEAEVARAKEMIRQKLVPDNSAEKEEARLLDLRRQLILATDSGPVGTADIAGAATDEEDREVRRIQALIKDSPDLVNAKSVEIEKYGDSSRYGTPLHRAAQQGQLVVARFLIDNGADLDSRDGSGRTPLHWAALRGHRSMAELLLAKGAGANAGIGVGFGSQGYTPLHLAAQKGYRNVCEALLAGKADVNARTSGNKWTALQLAAQIGFTSVAELLLARGAEVNARDSGRGTPLHAAAGSGAKATVELLLANKGDINAQTIHGGTPLYHAVTGDHEEVVRLLLAAKANPNLALNENSQNPGWTPLVAAINRENVPMARLLLENGAAPNVFLYRNGYTVLMRATEKGALELAEALIAAGADVNAKDHGDVRGTALYAVTSNNPTNAAAIVELLIKNKADVNAANAYNFTPLIQAVDKRNLDVVKLLVENGADVNAMTRGGESPLSLIKPRRQTGLSGFGVPPVRIAWPAGIGGAPGQPNQPAPDPTPEIIALLEQRGARDDLQRLTAISTSRNQEDRRGWFVKGTNDWNHFTLMELIAFVNPRRDEYNNPSYLAFPDLTRIAVSRIDPKTAKTEDIRMDVATPLVDGDCSKDVRLQWGDVVDIPEQDHFVDARWERFPDAYYKAFQKCLERTVRVTIKGQTTNVVLTPFRERGGANPWESRMAGFRLNRFLRGSGLLLSSSDVTRVKVRRTDPTTKQVRERFFDLDQIQSQQQQGNDANDLWLQDGDVIEVPERDSNAAPAPAPGAAAAQPGVPDFRSIPSRDIRSPRAPK
jgi:ankyrin repeat protein